MLAEIATFRLTIPIATARNDGSVQQRLSAVAHSVRFTREKDRPVELVLYENRPLRLDWAGGEHLECISGRAWITSTNNPYDIELRPREAFRVPRNGLTLVEAYTGSCRVRTRVGHRLSDMAFAVRLQTIYFNRQRMWAREWAKSVRGIMRGN
jgi:hypothetical protein